jgi:hypothetical protein
MTPRKREARARRQRAKRDGRCYELSLKHVLKDRFAGWCLVHGYVLKPDGSRLDNAWLERDDQVFDVVLNARYPLAAWPAVPLKKFSRTQAVLISALCKHFGPWTDLRAGDYRN